MPFKLRLHVIDLPHGKYSGKRLGDQPKDEAEHFIRCPACCGWIDCRDLGMCSSTKDHFKNPAVQRDGTEDWGR